MRKEVSFRERIVPWLFLAPSLIFVSIMVFIPLLDVLRRSFFQAAGGRFVGFENYLAVLDNSAFKLAAGITRNFQNLISCAYGNTGGFDCPFVACDFS